jgi:multicomponent K+:H+ antiporter subunit A
LRTILASGDSIRNNPYYLAPLVLIGFAALTKSAQFPAHIWLPDAMAAPTPASAYLHSATMVKAGIFLMARLHPAMGYTDAWFWLLSTMGLFTMVVGAYLGFKQNDLKALLAYSTISQLGVLILLIGQETEIAFKAFVVGLLAHALYKSALFLTVGIIDHETGTRDLRKLGGLSKLMPFTFIVTVMAGLSMAGLPPLFGFLAKETLLATAIHPSVPPIMNTILSGATIFAGAFLLAQSLLLIVGTFLGKPGKYKNNVHDPAFLMLLAPLIPASLSLFLGILPEPESIATLLAYAAQNIYGAPVKVSLALWTGINVPLFLSSIAIGSGIVLFYYRHEVRLFQSLFAAGLSWNAIYRGFLRGLDQAAAAAVRLQLGKLRNYLAVILISWLGITLLFIAQLSAIHYENFLQAVDFRIPATSSAAILFILQIFALFLVVASALASVFLRRDFHAIIALGAMGLSLSILMVLEFAPDVALVQIVVDILAVIVLILALSRIPRPQRIRAREFTFMQSRTGLVRDALIALVAGAIVFGMTFIALTSRPRVSNVTGYYEENAKILTGAKDIVSAIIVDYRATDTQIEILVYCLAGLGVYTLLRYASRTAGDPRRILQDPESTQSMFRRTFGIHGLPTSSFIHALAYAALPIATTIAVVHMIYGHERPGDGFTAGVILSLAVGFWYIVFGYQTTRMRLFWLRAAPLTAAGLLLAVITASLGWLINGVWLSHVDFARMWNLTLPEGVGLTTSFLFEIAVFLTVLGSTTYIINTLGHPGFRDIESVEWEQTQADSVSGLEIDMENGISETPYRPKRPTPGGTN